MIKKILLSLIGIFLLLGCKTNQPYNGILWLLKKDNKSVYIYGVGHYTLGTTNLPPGYVKDAIQKSKEILLEANPNDLKISSEIIPKSNYDLFEEINLSAQSEFDYWIENNYYSKENVDALRRRSILIAYYSLQRVGPVLDIVDGKRTGFESPHSRALPGVENIIKEIAIKNNKPVNYLEPADYSMKMWRIECNNIKNNSELIKSISEYAKNFSNTNKQLHALDAALILGDWGGVTRINKEMIGEWRHEELMTNCVHIPRNRYWVMVIDDAKTNQNVFVTVGISHLPGENGLINLLKNKGYSATLINQ